MMALKKEDVVITSAQKECIEFKADGSLLVRGIPGSGKTTVLLERAKWLNKNAKHITQGEKVVVLTYNKSLTNFMRQLSLKEGEPVKSTTFHSWGIQLLKKVGCTNLFTLNSDEQWSMVNYARNIVMKNAKTKILPSFSKGRHYKKQINFLVEEISWLKTNNINSREKYLNTLRAGRGGQVRVTKEMRETIYDINEKYMDLLSSKRKIDFDDVAILLEHKTNEIVRRKLNPSHILIDEAQDLNARQLKVIGMLAGISLTIAADKGQKIYRRQFTWKSVGIDIHKSRSKFLLNTFRSTKEIISLAKDIQEFDALLMKDDEYLPAQDPVASGPLPQLLMSKNMEQELLKVTEVVSAIRKSFENDTVAIIANTNARLDDYAKALDENKIPWSMIKGDNADLFKPGVKLVTYYSAKGLEFDHVIATGLKEGLLPYTISEDADENEQEDFLCTEIRKLYVAMTRAKYHLILSAVEPVSRFIDLMDSRLYQMYRGIYIQVI